MTLTKDTVYGGEIYDIPRQRSACKIIVYSHVLQNNEDPKTGVIDCSSDVVNCEVSKTTRGGGGASFLLVPRKNYLNSLYPDDHVHIYFNPGDGRGWIRTFFGFIDRISRQIDTDNDGRTTTRYVVSCSDFTKAFDKTNIYFNPSLVDRGDFASKYFMGTKAIGGSALRTKGISVSGTPADIVMGLAQLLMGFGAQYALPRSYPPEINGVISARRNKRYGWLRGKLSKELESKYTNKTLSDIKKDVEEEYKKNIKAIEKALKEDRLKDDTDVPKYVVLASINRLYEEVNSFRYSQALDAENAAKEDVSNVKLKSLTDYLDYSFVEYDAIDGAIIATPIWQEQGPLWSIMNSWANSFINELFCDLRPVGEGKYADLQQGNYLLAKDELGGNVEGADGAPSVLYAPALIMREYPFSTIEGYSPNGKIQILDSIPLGDIIFGAVFSKDPNITGRKVVKIPALNPYTIIRSSGEAQALKHIDAVTITTKDIINENIGRSDADTCNLIELYADIGLGNSLRFMTQDVQPICTPISIARHGLRVRTETTKYARWPSSKYTPSGVDSALVRYMTIRWAMLLDHWYQHNIEYLTGVINTRAFPEIRVGYRLDISDRKESYYVEGVNHSWKYDDTGAFMSSTFTLGRGQRNDPFPIYVLPPLAKLGGIENRGELSRMAYFFDIVTSSATAGSSLFETNNNVKYVKASDSEDMSFVDIPRKCSRSKWWAKYNKGDGFLSADSVHVTYTKSKNDVETNFESILDGSNFKEDDMGELLGVSVKTPSSTKGKGSSSGTVVGE